jgi:hypothetical protein
MVTFSRIPYAEATERARRQDRIVFALLGAFAILILFLLLWLLTGR